MRWDGNKLKRIRISNMVSMILLFLIAGNDPIAQTNEVVDDYSVRPELPASPTVDKMLPAELQNFWKPWHGDFDGMIERRVVRVLTTYGGYQFYYDEGKPRGATYEMLRKLENYLNTELDRGHIRVHVLPIPVSRDQLIPALLAGHGDLIATDLTMTPERQARIEFTRPLLTDIDEIVVLGPGAVNINSIEDLAGREIFVRESSSYYEHLKFLSGMFEENQLAPLVLVSADELLEGEDLLEMISIGEADITVMDDYKAEFWSGVLPDIAVRSDLAIASGGSIAWAHRKESPKFAEHLEAFLKRYGKGSLFGNDTYNRYLASATRERCSNSTVNSENIEQLVSLFTKYGEKYSFDWLRLAAQAYQESGLKQNRKSHAGAVGIMQIKPSTAADRNVAVPDVTQLENNIHAGSKYLRFIADRYFSDSEFSELDQWLFSLAAYNAGPARVIRLRNEARENGYDPEVWFDNVEIIAARRIGRETVTYVSNVFKYYVAYQLTVERQRSHSDRFGDLLIACNDT
jgi:membrane-bound lytic murein transglycosylase MltF